MKFNLNAVILQKHASVTYDLIIYRVCKFCIFTTHVCNIMSLKLFLLLLLFTNKGIFFCNIWIRLIATHFTLCLRNMTNQDLVLNVDAFKIHSPCLSHFTCKLSYRCIINYSYTLRTLRTCNSQSKLRILKIRERSARALYQYNCTLNTSRNACASIA